MESVTENDRALKERRERERDDLNLNRERISSAQSISESHCKIAPNFSQPMLQDHVLQ